MLTRILQQRWMRGLWGVGVMLSYAAFAVWCACHGTQLFHAALRPPCPPDATCPRHHGTLCFFPFTMPLQTLFIAALGRKKARQTSPVRRWEPIAFGIVTMVAVYAGVIFSMTFD